MNNLQSLTVNAGDAPDMEVYINPDPENTVFEVWVPVRKIAGLKGLRKTEKSRRQTGIF